jgi:ribosomal-protein-alanine N-acetyltransferase
MAWYCSPSRLRRRRLPLAASSFAGNVFRLREGVAADLQSLFDLDQICFPPNIAYSLGEFRSLLKSRSAVCIVAEQGETLAGFCIAQLVKSGKTRGGHIVTIDVAPEFRRHGLGRLLMERVKKQLQREDASWLRLEVAVDNTAAQNFYQSLGFIELGRIPDYYDTGVDALALEKSLALKRDG